MNQIQKSDDKLEKFLFADIIAISKHCETLSPKEQIYYLMWYMDISDPNANPDFPADGTELFNLREFLARRLTLLEMKMKQDKESSKGEVESSEPSSEEKEVESSEPSSEEKEVESSEPSTTKKHNTTSRIIWLIDKERVEKILSELSRKQAIRIYKDSLDVLSSYSVNKKGESLEFKIPETEFAAEQDRKHPEINKIEWLGPDLGEGERKGALPFVIFFDYFCRRDIMNRPIQWEIIKKCFYYDGVELVHLAQVLGSHNKGKEYYNVKGNTAESCKKGNGKTAKSRKKDHSVVRLLREIFKKINRIITP